MAVSVSASAAPTNWFTNNNGNTLSLSYVSGDVLVVIGGGENAQQSPAQAPTATNVTFTQRDIDNTGGFDYCSMGIWTGTATGSGSTVTMNGTGGQHEGYYAWNLGTSATETGLTTLAIGLDSGDWTSVSVPAGSGIFYVLLDWNAGGAPGHTPETITGATATTRVDTSGSSYAVQVVDWLNPTGGTHTVGMVNYTGSKVTHGAVILPAAAAAAGGIVTPTLSTAQRHLLTR